MSATTRKASADPAGSPQRVEPALQIRDLTVRYSLQNGGELVALEGADLEIEAGTFVSLVGPSGCGKSTLLNVVGGLVEKSSGDVLFHGEPVSGPSPRLGMMFQSAVLFPWRSVLDNVLLPCDVAHTRTRALEERAKELLASVELAGFERSYPRELSGGMRQRVALCRLLIQDPDVLLLDEPFGALDEFTREAMNLMLLDFWHQSGKTILFVTHNIQEAVFLSDRVVVMTPRPGRLARVLNVDIPHPRQISVMARSEFNEIVFEARSLLGVS